MSARRPDQLRPVTLAPAQTAAAGGVVITQGETCVLCTASLARGVPPFLLDETTGEPTQGWITAEYAMLPGSTPDRKKRGPDSRATEIRRLLGRSLRAAVDMTKMPGWTITCDCDVMVADGGTRTASITGAFVALAQAVEAARAAGHVTRQPVKGPVAAVSAGVVDGKVVLDLDYDLDSRAEVDLNIVMNHRGEFVELQGTGEQTTFSHDQLQRMLTLGERGIRRLTRQQRRALREL